MELPNEWAQNSRSDFIRQATERYIEEVGGMKVVEIRENVSLKQASEEILAYLKEHKEAETFDIANDLRLGPKLHG